MRGANVLAWIVAFETALAWIPGHAMDVADGFTADVLATDLNAAAAMAVAPDGRVFIAEQTGLLRVWKDGRLAPKPALDLSERLDTYWERGLIGVALHPDFPHTPHLFVLYVAKEPFPHHVVSRFTVVGDQVDASSEHVLLEGDDQSKIGGTVPWGHQGGPLCFGPDGCLYIGLGEQTAGAPAQSLEALSGKILRLHTDGRVPEDNPFFGQTAGKYRAIWALGIRNPFGLAVQPGTGRLFETDVGQTSWEEVNEIVRGGNYGWPEVEGVGGEDRFRDPIYSYPPAIGRSICGGDVRPGGGAIPKCMARALFLCRLGRELAESPRPESSRRCDHDCDRTEWTSGCAARARRFAAGAQSRHDLAGWQKLETKHRIATSSAVWNECRCDHQKNRVGKDTGGHWSISKFASDRSTRGVHGVRDQCGTVAPGRACPSLDFHSAE